jgi:class 3 adenylate cyclase
VSPAARVLIAPTVQRLVVRAGPSWRPTAWQELGLAPGIGRDYFGRTVNLAARMAEYARPGEVVVSQEVVDAAEGGPVRFTEIGPVELKGVPGPLRLHSARRHA